MERKELQSHDALAIWGAVNIREANGKTYKKEFYEKAEVDSVMDAMEARIKELEQELTNYREDEKGYTEND